MGIFRDIMALLTKQKIIFVEKKQETPTIMSFIFKAEKPLKWQTGQHGMFSMDKSKVEGKAWRMFSIASTPEENHIMISTKVSPNPSSYKLALMNLQPGDPIFIRGPIGQFYVEDLQQPVLFIAGGIGIAPFRALVHSYAQDGTRAPKSVDLLYSQREEDYAFQQELDQAAQENNFLKIHYLSSRDALRDEILSFTSVHGNDGRYLVAGAPEMVESVKKLLKEQGILSKHIKNDPFMGL